MQQRARYNVCQRAGGEWQGEKGDVPHCPPHRWQRSRGAAPAGCSLPARGKEDKLLPFDTISREAICVFIAACTCCIHKHQPLFVVPPGPCGAHRLARGRPSSQQAATHRARPWWPGNKHCLFISRFSSEDVEETLKKWYL